MRALRATIILIGVLGATSVECPAQDHPYSVALFGSFTTSSKLFHHPHDADEILRSQFLPLDNILSAGIDIRRTLEGLRLQVGLSAEYLSKTETIELPAAQGKKIPITDGFTAIPVELSGYFLVPVGSQNLHVYMGGGGALYLGDRQYEYAGEQAETIEHGVGYGIHIMSGIEYAMESRISVRSELKFRDIQFETTSDFKRDAAIYHGSTVALDQSAFSSRISVDGMTFNIGLVYHF